MATLYETLGVREDASDDEIKRAYRRAAMRAHPDRNKGREAAAHDAFQEIKQAYAILSDPEQRGVYDAVFAEEMRKLHEREAQQAQAARERAERAAQAERERYERYVSQAMRYAERGHNRDVVFGVLLGRGCDDALAGRIADGVAALCAARAQASGRIDETTSESVHSRAQARPSSEREVSEAHEPHANGPAYPGSSEPTEPTEPPVHAGLFSTLWHGVFGVRP